MNSCSSTMFISFENWDQQHSLPEPNGDKNKTVAFNKWKASNKMFSCENHYRKKTFDSLLTQVYCWKADVSGKQDRRSYTDMTSMEAHILKIGNKHLLPCSDDVVALSHPISNRRCRWSRPSVCSFIQLSMCIINTLLTFVRLIFYFLVGLITTNV